MSIYKQFFHETLDESGNPIKVGITYPENFNFGYDVVDAIADRSPEKRAIVWCNTAGESCELSFSQIRDRSNQAANALKSAGLKRGDRVMVILKRHLEYWFVAVALHKLGITMIPATHMLTVSDLKYRLSAAKVDGVIVTPQNEIPCKVRQALADTGHRCKCFCVRSDEEGFVNLSHAMESAPSTLSRIPTSAHDPMLLYFTSGTTGNPKGVIHDFTYPLAHIVTAKYWQQAEDGGLHFSVAETGWAKASWGKIYGQWLVGSAVMVYDFDTFDPKQLTSVINRYGVTSFCAPPTVYRYLVRKGIPAMPHLRHASTAGEMLSPEVFRTFTEKTGIRLCEGYGQTETTLLMANFMGNAEIAGSMGRISPMYHIELRNKDGSQTKVGEIGEVVIVPPENGRQIGVFIGYLDNEEHYRHVWRGGVYHTGDAAWQDENGLFYFHGRFDDIIKTGGFRVGPYEIEHVLSEHPAVSECSVFGIPDPHRGQAIKAVVVPTDGFEASKELELAIKDFCNTRLAEYKWIKILEFAAELPKTISGKIKKGHLREKSTD